MKRALVSSLLLCSGGATAPAPHTDVDVVVVGAGYAGLAAAQQLYAAGLRVAVLEATDHVGGRTRNFDLASGVYDTASDAVVEVGGTFVAPGHTALIALAQETGHSIYNVSTGGAPGAGGGQRWRRPRLGAPPGEWPWWFWGVDTDSALAASVFLTRSGRHLFTKPSDVRAAFDDATWTELEAAGDALQREAAQIECDHDTPLQPLRAYGDPDGSSWFEKDAITFEGWLRTHLQEPESRSVLRNMCRGMIAQEPAQVSFLSTLKSLKGCWSAGAEDQYRIRGGTQAVPLTLAKRLAASTNGSFVELSMPVRAIDIDTGRAVGRSGGAVLTVSAANGTTLTAHYAILTGPPALVGAITISPPAALGHTQAQLLQRMPMGSSMKYFVTYATPWWRDAGLSGAVMASSWASRGRVRAVAAATASGTDGGMDLWGDHFDQCMEHSPFDGTTGAGATQHFALMCWIEGETNQHFYATLGSAEEQREHVLNFLVGAFNDTRAKALAKDVVAHNWADQPFARGAYTGYFSPGVQSQAELWAAFAALQNGKDGGWAPHVWVAGSDYQTGFGNGYIEGAIRGGYAAATAVQAAHAAVSAS